MVQNKCSIDVDYNFDMPIEGGNPVMTVLH